MSDFKSGKELGKAVSITSTKGTFGTDLKKKTPKKKKKDFKASPGLASKV